MRRFRKILVGVDLSWGDRLVSDRLTKPNREAVQRALWLAQISSASVTFFSTLDVSAVAQRMILKAHHNLLEEAEQELQKLVDEAQSLGLKAESEVRFGPSWLEIIRKVMRDGDDLVIVGSRQLGHVQGVLLGSTVIKLVRKCPCPVWVTLPHEHDRVQKVLVAHCLRPVGDLALELGASLAELSEASLHVHHALTLPEIEIAGQAPSSLGTHQDQAEETIHEQLARHQHSVPPRLHVNADRPDAVIPMLIQEEGIDLLVAGTVGNTGIAGLITGSTTERLLPRVTCSVLAVKPPDFVSPIQPEAG